RVPESPAEIEALTPSPPTPPVKSPPSPFDPFSPNVVVVIRTSGREAALAAPHDPHGSIVGCRSARGHRHGRRAPHRQPRGGGRLTGWGGKNRTFAWRNQNPLPYRLAT